jgi:hypothetical protein
MADEDPQEVRIQAEIDRLLSEANVERLRGRFQEAEQRCREVLRRDEGNVAAYELLGDLEYAQGRLSRASGDLPTGPPPGPQPGLPGGESGPPDGGGDPRRDGTGAGRRAAGAAGGPGGVRNPVNACLLSLLVPGLGQIYNRDYGLGIGLLSGFMLLGGYVFNVFMQGLLSHRSPRLWESFRLFFREMSLGGQLFFGFCLLLLIGLYLYTVITAPLRSMALNREKEEVWI